MPVDPGTTLPIFQGMLSSNSIVGQLSGQMSAGLSAGLSQYVSSAITVISIDVGTLGAGTGIGAGIIIPSSTILGTLTAMMVGNGITGTFAAPLSNAASNGISVSFAGAILNTVNPSVGVGAGKIQIIPLGLGGGIFAGAFAAAGMTGMMAPALGNAVGLALDSVISSAVGIIAIVGPPSIIPSSGSGLGKIT